MGVPETCYQLEKNWFLKLQNHFCVEIHDNEVHRSVLHDAEDILHQRIKVHAKLMKSTDRASSI